MTTWTSFLCSTRRRYLSEGPVLIVDGGNVDVTAGIESHAMTLHKPFVFARFVQAVESLAETAKRGGRN